MAPVDDYRRSLQLAIRLEQRFLHDVLTVQDQSRHTGAITLQAGAELGGLLVPDGSYSTQQNFDLDTHAEIVQ